MNFIKILKKLKEEYKDNYTERKNGTLLLGPSTIPKCKHMLFRPLNDELIKEYLILAYENTFPTAYIELLKYSNGANLLSEKIEEEGLVFAHSMLVIFGLPTTPPFQRKKEEEEPFDVRVEDLSRHNNISRKWLKFGTYCKKDDFDHQYDLFVDTKTDIAYSCERKKDLIDEKWTSIDECLCSIYERLTK